MSSAFNAKKVAEARRKRHLVKKALSPCEEPEPPRLSPANSKNFTTQKGHSNKTVRPPHRTWPTQRNASPGPSSRRLVVNSDVRESAEQSQKSRGIKRKASTPNTDSSGWSPPPSILPDTRKKAKIRLKAKEGPTKKKARHLQNDTKFLGTIEIHSSDEAPQNTSGLFRPEIINLCSDEEVDEPKLFSNQVWQENDYAIIVSSDDERITAVVPKTSVPRSIEPRKRAARKRPTSFHSARVELDDLPAVPIRSSNSPIPITCTSPKPDNYVMPLVLQEDPDQQELLEEQDQALESEIIPEALQPKSALKETPISLTFPLPSIEVPVVAPRCSSIPHTSGSSSTRSCSFGQQTISLQALYKEELSRCAEELPGTSISAFSRSPIPRVRKKAIITYSTSPPLAPVLTPLFFSQSILLKGDAPLKSALVASLVSIHGDSGQPDGVHSSPDVNPSLLNSDTNLSPLKLDGRDNDIRDSHIQESSSVQLFGDQCQPTLLNDSCQFRDLTHDKFEDDLEQRQLIPLGDPGKDQWQAYERPLDDEVMDEMKCLSLPPQDTLSPDQLSTPLDVENLAALKSRDSDLAQVLVESKTLETILNKISLPKIGNMLVSWRPVRSALKLWTSEDNKPPLSDELQHCADRDVEMGRTSSPCLLGTDKDQAAAFVWPTPQESPDAVSSRETHSSNTTKVEPSFTITPVEAYPDFSIFDISTITSPGSPDKMDDFSLADLELVYPDDIPT